jgi:quercetin dioxygenase-like cupin family protein
VTYPPGVRYLIDGYADWVERQKLPVHTGLAVDLMTAQTRPWARIGADAAFVHLDARGDFCSLYLCDIAPGGSTQPIRHLYEAIVYALDGSGSTVVELPGGERRSFEWRRGSLFSLPVNATYRLFNASGSARARLSFVTDLPLVMKLYRNERFVFDTPFDFTERFEDEKFLRGEGVYIPVREHRNMWQTNFVPDLVSFGEVRDDPGRGKGAKHIVFDLADGSLGSHIAEIPPGNYKKAHNHAEGYHIFQLSGAGYSLYWQNKDFRAAGEQPQRVDWTYGLLHSPPRGVWHQHFNISDQPARYMAIAFGSSRYPILAEKRAQIEKIYTTKSEFQIDYEDEDSEIRRLFDDACAAYARSRAQATPAM